MSNVQVRACACGCGRDVAPGNVYFQGDDAKHRERLITALVGSGSVRERADRINALLYGLSGNSESTSSGA